MSAITDTESKDSTCPPLCAKGAGAATWGNVAPIGAAVAARGACDHVMSQPYMADTIKFAEGYFWKVRP